MHARCLFRVLIESPRTAVKLALRCAASRNPKSVWVARVVFTYGKITNPSWESVISCRPRNTTRVRTRRPTNARTVSLLLSLAFRSPISPEPMTESEAKCVVTAALEPPATIPHTAREEPLRHSAAMRIPEPKSRPVNVCTNLSSCGDSTSRTMAISFKMSARNRYVFASGKREVPNQ